MENMNDNHNDNQENEKEKTGANKKYNKGFYIALAFCLLAMGAAAWTTYSSVADYMKPDPVVQTTQPKNKDQQAGANVSGVPANSTTDPTQDGQFATTNPTQAQTEPSTEDTAQSATENPSDGSHAKKLIFPVGDKIVKEYSGNTPVYSKTLKDWRLHKGTDFAASKGDTVQSIDDGNVYSIKKDSMLGTVIAVEHNSGFVAYYCGVKAGDNIKEGTHLSAGDVIGTVDKIPEESKDEAHLHLEIQIDGKYVNPADVLNNKVNA